MKTHYDEITVNPDELKDKERDQALRKLEATLSAEHGKKVGLIGTVYIKSNITEDDRNSAGGRYYHSEAEAMADLPRLTKEFGSEIGFTFDHFIDPDTHQDTPGKDSGYIKGTSFLNVGEMFFFYDSNAETSIN